MSAVGKISLRGGLLPRRGARERSRLLVFNHAVLILLTAFAVMPLLVLAFNSVKTNAEIGLNPLGPPTQVIAENYASAWERGDFATTMGNSVVYVVATIAAELVLGGLAAYALARRKPPGSDMLMLYFLVASTVPVWMYIVPLFVQFRAWGLLNTMHGLVIVYVAMNAPLTIFLLRSYMIDLPGELEDAARVDGANEFQVFTRIVLPLSKPGFLTVGLVVGLGVWNEFFLALTFIHDPSMFPITTSFYKFTDRFSRDWALTSAGAIIVIFPIVALFLALQRQFIEGLAEGGVKT
ncbi:MAG: carbohydrate ABC transporter permease [Chloroflexi bacterium]|nr:carbohydrate ABC transporter permease [Chloroflexota bacterium]MCY4246053.1 carbohydrate ABC transporter permease [Chloroflexota bacterium]